MSATSVYRLVIAVQGCWLLVEWLFDWGPHSQVTSFTLMHPYATLISNGVAVALSLTVQVGMWFFQRWARWIFVVTLAIAVLVSPFRVHRYSLSAPPSFVPVIAAAMLLLTGVIVAMSFLPPVRECFDAKNTSPDDEALAAERAAPNDR